MQLNTLENVHILIILYDGGMESRHGHDVSGI